MSKRTSTSRTDDRSAITTAAQAKACVVDSLGNSAEHNAANAADWSRLMPNWCNNVVTLKHWESRYIDSLIAAAREGRMLEEFCPCPVPLIVFSHDGTLLWRLRHWGTKWDVAEVHVNRVDDTTVKLAFDSAWTPPVAWFGEMEKIGFAVDAFYLEGGVGFCGRFTDGECREFDIDGDEIPADIKTVFEDYFDDLENSGAQR